MKFDELDQQMRVFETNHDHCVLPGLWMVARIDGRSFTRLTKDVMAFDAPFDLRFRDTMLETAEHLMGCGFRIIYGYTQSDEISLLFDRDEDTFGRKTRKLNSVLAGEASAALTLQLNRHAAFDCRICELPSVERVRDYFRWRQEDAHRNALNGHCYWMLRRQERSAAEATKQLKGMSIADKNELLFQSGVNFNDLPAWQKRGVGLYWQQHQKSSHNPLTGAETQAVRRRIHRDMELPIHEQYAQFITDLVRQNTAAQGGAS